MALVLGVTPRLSGRRSVSLILDLLARPVVGRVLPKLDGPYPDD